MKSDYIAYYQDPRLSRLVNDIEAYPQHSDRELAEHSIYFDNLRESQIKRGISGICWFFVEFEDRIIEVPRIYDELLAIPGDLDILMGEKDKQIDFLSQVQATAWEYQAGDEKILSDLEVKKYCRSQKWLDLDEQDDELFVCGYQKETHERVEDSFIIFSSI